MSLASHHGEGAHGEVGGAGGGGEVGSGGEEAYGHRRRRGGTTARRVGDRAKAAGSGARRGRGVRPGVAGLLIGIECSRVKDSSWMYLISLVTIRIGVELAAVQRKLPDCVVVELQLYSARTFHITLSPRYIKAGRDPLQTIINT